MKTHPLFRALLLLFICCSLQTAKGQWVSIPDTNFGMWLTRYGTPCVQGNNQIGWQLDTTCPAVVNDTNLAIGWPHTVRDLTGVQYFDNLRRLYCPGSTVTTLGPKLPNTLTQLICTGNPITALPTLPNGLLELSASRCLISVFPPLPNGLKNFSCGSPQLTSLPTLPDSLENFDVSGSPITSLPALPNKIRFLFCESNLLTSLPTLPDSLEELYCYDNLLTTLPPLPDKLWFISCEMNQLTTLPALPVNPLYDMYLSCGWNLLTNLPPIHRVLGLYCQNNLLTHIPAAICPYYLNCSNNQLTSIPALPDTVGLLNVTENPLTCLPTLTTIKELYFDSTFITCLPNYGSVDTSYPSLGNIPLCDAFNSNGCEVSWNISGKIYEDVNNDCSYNGLDTVYPNIKLLLYQSGNLIGQTYTTGEGYYSVDIDGYGTYDYWVDSSHIPFMVGCPASGFRTSTITALDSADTNMDFALSCKPGFDLKAHSIVANRFRPINNTTVEIGAGDATNFYGAHCATGVSGAVTITFTGPVSYVSPASGALTPTVSDNTLTYSIADFSSVNFFEDFDFILVTDTFAQIGQQVCVTVSVTPTAGDNNPANNTLTRCFDVLNSYDPNDKRVHPAGDIDTAQEWLTYTVRFQNTGTAEAQHIYITDTLDSNIDVASFQLLAYSHQPMVQIKENAVRFNYPNINLPDSNTNEPESHGYVQYKVKLKENLAIGTQINNTAFIYFDFNEPVITNTTTNTISLISGISKSEIAHPQFEMFPNPANDVVSVIVDEPLIGAVLTVSDITGRNMVVMNIEHRMSNIEVTDFSAGIYFVAVTSNGRSLVKRLAVQK